MNILISLFQDSYEDLNIHSLLIGVIVTLSGVIIYLYKSKENALKEKDVHIMKISKAHQQDLREGINAMKSIASNYFKFTQTIKEFINGSK